MPTLRQLGLFMLISALLTGAPARAQDHPDLLLEVRLGRHVLSEAMSAYQHGNDVLLPLGEVARILTLAIRFSAKDGQASGYILDEQRGFHLDLAAHVVVQGSRRQSFDASLVRRTGDELYVPSRILAAWLPVDLSVDLSTLVLTVHAREKLPLQARLERQDRPQAGHANDLTDYGYPRVDAPYRMLSMPFIDQTLDLDLHGRAGSATYTSYLTADLLGTEAALFYRTGQGARLTLGRHDPGATLLGPLRARTAQVGSIASADAPNITLGSTLGNGFLVSNRQLTHPARFDRHTLYGDLPPGWDVELYFNDALVGFQQSRADGRYSFDDQPLIYGANEFRLLFHGPLGQVRIERHTFLLEQSMLAPGQFNYSVSAQRDEQGGAARISAQFEYGFHRRLTASAALVRMPQVSNSGSAPRTYANLGLHCYLDNLIISADLAANDGAGTLGQLAFKTRVKQLAIGASHARLRHFASDLYPVTADPITQRSEVRIDGQVAILPLSLHVRRDTLASGALNQQASARLSAYRYATAMSGALRWQSLAGITQADALLQATRRVAGIGISGQLHYALKPRAQVSALALSADKHLEQGYLLSAGVSRTFIDSHYAVTAGLTKSLGRFGLGLTALYSHRNAYGIGLQLFTAMGRPPRGDWLLDAAPMAASGHAQARVFLDKNNDGIMNHADTPIANAGFLINGSNLLARTGDSGAAWLGRLPPHQYADIALDPTTLEDPQWQARVKGLRIVPRPGTVNEIDFAVGITGEIDGSAYLAASGDARRRPAGDLELELLDAALKIVGSTRTGADGYYIMAAVPPGRYHLRVSPTQLARLKLMAPPAHAIHIDQQANFVNGKDFELTPR